MIPDPEPKEIDETLSIELRHLASNAVLKGKPSGKEKCENCLYYLEPYNELSVLLAPQAPHPGGRRMVVPVVGTRFPRASRSVGPPTLTGRPGARW